MNQEEIPESASGKPLLAIEQKTYSDRPWLGLSDEGRIIISCPACRVPLLTYWNLRQEFRRDGENAYDCARHDFCTIADGSCGHLIVRKTSNKCNEHDCSVYSKKICVKVVCCFCNDPGMKVDLSPGGFLACGAQTGETPHSVVPTDVVGYDHGALEEKDDILTITTQKRET